ncbi:trypsin-like serine peptidase [Novosphingobium profundi]|uniref:trypsin-like serine peptidase n=1 Tax=Novosphingobium profundi TaxID=1774954 RepID=UPI001CFDD9EF|nr:trypsin-like peptidase domain-containing protein [Novosphingobium profundi]
MVFRTSAIGAAVATVLLLNAAEAQEHALGARPQLQGPDAVALEQIQQMQLPDRIVIDIQTGDDGRPIFVYDGDGPDLPVDDFIPQMVDPYIMPVDLQVTGKQIKQHGQELILDHCQRTGTFAQILCREGNALQGAAVGLLKAGTVYPECAPAARTFRRYYKSGTPSSQVSSRFDLHCLGSFAPRLGEGADDPRQTARKTSSLAILSAVGLFAADGIIRCSGLFYRPSFFITASHCLDDASGKKFTVSAADGSFQGQLVSFVNGNPRPTDEVQKDWVVFRLDDAEGFDFPEIRLEKLPSPREVNIVKYYPFGGDTQLGRATPAHFRHLRFQKPGMCQALMSASGCLQIACQTIRGFSGAPIFNADASSENLVVYGLVSGSRNNGGSCPSNYDITDTTMALSAEQITVEN